MQQNDKELQQLMIEHNFNAFDALWDFVYTLEDNGEIEHDQLESCKERLGKIFLELTKKTF